MEREQAPNAERIEKQRRWDEIAARVAVTVDKLNHHIDEGIKEGVIALNAFGINTTASCEGHSNRGTRAPWIDVESKEIEALNKKGGELREAGASEEELKAVAAEIERKNLEERRKLFIHLEEFYKDRSIPYHQQLIVQGKARGWSRLESQGSGLQKVEDEATQEQRLGEYRAEMEAFISFLKEKYFGSGE